MQTHAPLAQWIERLPPKQEAAGSSPARGTAGPVPTGTRAPGYPHRRDTGIS